MKSVVNLGCISVVFSFIFTSVLFAQAMDFTAFRAEVDFSKKLRDWDGFGVNYVEVAQTVDYDKDPQEYGDAVFWPVPESQEK